MTGLDHPVRDEVIAAGETEWRDGGGRSCRPRCQEALGSVVFYQKHMAHHLLPGVDRAWIAGLD